MAPCGEARMRKAPPYPGLPMTIYRLDLTKRKLAALPPTERRLLILLGHASNEINVLQRLIVMSRQSQHKNKSTGYVQAWQTLFLIRLLIGKLHDAWELFQVRFQDNRVAASKYIPQLGESGVKALTSLKQHFASGSPLSRIRNKFSFHYNDKDDLIDASFNWLPDDEPLLCYLSNIQGNSFYGASELVIAKGIVELAGCAPSGASAKSGSGEVDQGFENLYLLTLGVSDRMVTLFGQCIGAIVVTHIGNEAQLTEVEVGLVPKLSEIEVPFFVDQSELVDK
jgi:hypothetical protein